MEYIKSWLKTILYMNDCSYVNIIIFCVVCQ